MTIIANKEEYSVVDVMAKSIAWAADFNSDRYYYDKTFSCTILKTSTEVSSTLTEDEKSELDKLGECETDWYCVRINGVFYKLKSEEVSFKIDESVRVKVPCNDWKKIYIDFKKGTNNKRWVRPSDWLPLPKNIQPNESYLLVRGCHEISSDYSSSNYESIEVYTDESFNDNYTCIIDWGDGTNPETYSLGDSKARHIYTDTEWHWIKITYLDYDNAFLYVNDYIGRFVEFISGGYNGIDLNHPDNVCNTLEHIITGYVQDHFTYYGSRNLQCVEFISKQYISQENPYGAYGSIYGAACYDLIIHNDIINHVPFLFGWSALKYINLNKLNKMINVEQCWNLHEIYAPNCEYVNSTNLGDYQTCQVPNLKKITLKQGCVIETDSCLNYMPWVEIIYK